MAAPQITAITVTPSRQNPSTFSANMDQFLSETTSFQTQANAQADYNNALAIDVQSNSDLVALNAQATVGAANFKGVWADATGAATKGDSYYNNGQFFALNVDLANITASEPLVGDTDWSILSQGVFDYVVSQFAGGNTSKVGYIYAGVAIASFDYLIYPLDGRVYAKNGSTGTFSDPLDFNPSTGSDSGLTGTLLNKNITDIEEDISTIESDLSEVSNKESLYKKSVSITMADATYTLSATEQLYGRINIAGTLTAEQELIVGTEERFLTVKNNTSQPIKVVCAASGSGVHVPSDASFSLRVNTSSGVEADGVGNEILINELKSNGDTITFPFGLSDTNFYRIRSNGFRTGNTEIRRGLTMINFRDIEDYPTNWVMSSNTSSTGTNVNYDITRASSTTATVSASSAGVADMIYNLKDGLSY